MKKLFPLFLVILLCTGCYKKSECFGVYESKDFSLDEGLRFAIDFLESRTKKEDGKIQALKERLGKPVFIRITITHQNLTIEQILKLGTKSMVFSTSSYKYKIDGSRISMTAAENLPPEKDGENRLFCPPELILVDTNSIRLGSTTLTRIQPSARTNASPRH